MLQTCQAHLSGSFFIDHLGYCRLSVVGNVVDTDSFTSVSSSMLFSFLFSFLMALDPASFLIGEV